LQQLTKPELLNGEKVVNIQLSNNNIKVIHEALVSYMRARKRTDEQTAVEAEKLREEFNKIRILMNPS
jgi:hypothetical protein